MASEWLHFDTTIVKPKQTGSCGRSLNWQLRAELKPSSTMPNFHIRALFFVMDSKILHILKVNKLN